MPLEHVPGIKRTFPLPPADVQKGIGVLGLHEGRTLLVGLDRATRAKAVAGCDADPAKLAAARAERPDLFYTTDYAEMLARPEVEIVAVYTPDDLHGEHVVAAFEAGKDVICTKPLVSSVEAARAVLAAALGVTFEEAGLRARVELERELR